MATCDSDLLLLKRFAERNDTAAFAEIVRRYAAMVFSACRRIVRDTSLAEDVSQETFFRLMKRPESVSHSLGAWLHQSATNLAIDAVRSDSARRRREHVYAVDADTERGGQGPPQREVETWAELSPVVDEAMSELPAEARDLLIAHFLCGRPQNELAVEAGTSAATMCRRIRAAVESLQSRLRDRGMGVAPLALIGLLHDNGLMAAPHSLMGQLGKMSMVSSVRHWFAPKVAGGGQIPIFGTAAGIACASVVVGVLCTFLYTKAIPTKWIPSPSAQLLVDQNAPH